LGILVLLVSLVDPSEIISFFRNISPLSLSALFLVSVVLIAVSSLKWKILLNSLNHKFSFFRLFNFYLIGKFFNNFLPSNIGGDAIRLFLTAKGKRRLTDPFSAIFMERLTGLIALLLYACNSIILLCFYFNFQDKLIYLVPAVFGLIMISFLILFMKSKWIMSFSTNVRLISKVQDFIFHLFENLQSLKKNKKILIYCLIISLTYHSFTILNGYVAAWALNITVSIYSLFVFIPIILLISLVPISINGIGVMEGAFVICLTQTGISESAAISIALMIRAKNLLITSLFGGLLLLYYRHKNLILTPSFLK
jgi:uncharacterized protein (TIRG00374 family)